MRDLSVREEVLSGNDINTEVNKYGATACYKDCIVEGGRIVTKNPYILFIGCDIRDATLILTGRHIVINCRLFNATVRQYKPTPSHYQPVAKPLHW